MAGTISATAHKSFGTVRKITVEFTADAADASVPGLVLPSFEGFLLGILTNPGSTAPTDNYDIALNDADGVDRLAGAGANRDTSTSELAAALFASSSARLPVAVDDVLTLAITNNAVNSAVGKIVILYTPSPV